MVPDEGFVIAFEMLPTLRSHGSVERLTKFQAYFLREPVLGHCLPERVDVGHLVLDQLQSPICAEPL